MVFLGRSQGATERGQEICLIEREEAKVEERDAIQTTVVMRVPGIVWDSGIYT